METGKVQNTIQSSNIRSLTMINRMILNQLANDADISSDEQTRNDLYNLALSVLPDNPVGRDYDNAINRFKYQTLKQQHANISDDYGQRVVKLLQKAGLSKADIARYCAVGNRAVIRWDKGESIPEAKNIESLKLLLSELFDTADLKDIGSLAESVETHGDDYGQQIVKQLLSSGYQQKDIALATGNNEATVSKWKNGTSKPRYKNIKAMEDLLKSSSNNIIE